MNDNSNNTDVTIPEKRTPTVAVLQGGYQVVVRDIPKAHQGTWIVKSKGHYNPNPGVGGYVFNLTEIENIRANVPGLVGDLSIFDKGHYVQVTFFTTIRKPTDAKALLEQQRRLADLGVQWNEQRKQYEAPAEAYPAARSLLSEYAK